MELQEYETKLKTLFADLELMAHITSHDLRDPLRQAIINCDEITKNLSDSAATQLLGQTVDSINEVLSRIALLREYSYLANFNQELKPVDCNIILQKALESLAEKIKASNARINYDRLPIINGYEPHLIKLFTCLIDNSIKFKGNEPAEIAITCEQSGDFWQFKISDNGIGLDKVYRELVFALFQRLDPEIKDDSFGAGLAFCKKIVENHHGKIWFQPNEITGTSFYFTLPK